MELHNISFTIPDWVMHVLAVVVILHSVAAFLNAQFAWLELKKSMKEKSDDS